MHISIFIFSFFLFFETSIKIADSNIFIEWIGESLEKNLRYLIMFVICLNCTYFFTRITYQVIKSSGLCVNKLKFFMMVNATFVKEKLTFILKLTKIKTLIG